MSWHLPLSSCHCFPLAESFWKLDDKGIWETKPADFHPSKLPWFKAKQGKDKGYVKQAVPPASQVPVHFTIQAPANTVGVHLFIFPHIHWVPLETESADAMQIY